jgi:hypothetical protein
MKIPARIHPFYNEYTWLAVFYTLYSVSQILKKYKYIIRGRKSGRKGVLAYICSSRSLVSS